VKTLFDLDQRNSLSPPSPVIVERSFHKFEKIDLGFTQICQDGKLPAFAMSDCVASGITRMTQMFRKYEHRTIAKRD
jgi:hypothetical protein